VGLLEEGFRYARAQIDAIKNDVGEVKVGVARLDERVRGMEVRHQGAEVRREVGDRPHNRQHTHPILLRLAFK
jgi:hypothetical protein